MPKDTIHFSKQTDRDLERLLRYVLQEQKGGGALVVENKREKTRKQLIPI